LSTGENVKVHVSKKERLASGNEVEFGVEATVPKADALATFRHWRLMFQELVATPSPTVPVTPTTTPTAPAEPVGYNGLPWKQSEKRRELATILVTPELPLPAKELYDALSKSANLTLKLNDATYRLSKTDTGSEFLQRWTKASK
jgi:hypothetical protein